MLANQSTRDATFADVGDAAQQTYTQSPAELTLIQAPDKLVANLELARLLIARGQATDVHTLTGIEDRLVDFHRAGDIYRLECARVIDLARSLTLHRFKLNDQISLLKSAKAAFQERDHG